MAGYPSVRVREVGAYGSATGATTATATLVTLLAVGGVGRTVTFFNIGDHAQVQWSVPQPGPEPRNETNADS